MSKVKNNQIIRVSGFANIMSPDTPEILLLDDVLDQIKHPGSILKSIVGLVRKETDPDKQKELKVKLLPGICFSGIFSKRNDADLVEPNPIICLDLDHVADIPTEMDRIKKYPYVIAAFLSPTATGIKVVCRHDLTDPGYHKELYWKLGEDMGLTGRSDLKFDSACSNVSRFCFFSIDPQAYINKNAIPFHFDTSTATITTAKIPKPTSNKEIVFSASITDYRMIRARIQETHELFEKYYNMYPGVRNNNLYILASFFRLDGVPKDIAEGYLVAYYSDPSNGFPASEIRKTVESAYK